MTHERRHAPTCFMGLDAGTQSLKAVLIDRDLNRLAESAVDFDDELPEFGTDGGVHVHGDGMRVTSPVVMWVAALDRLLERLRDQGWPLAQVAAISGSGQQHGSVWWNRSAVAALRTLDPARPLREQLAACFAVSDSPVWMDSSTRLQCVQREKEMGGAQAVAELTGSRAYERFTGNQVARIYQCHPEQYNATCRIGLVSSFMASLLVGRLAEIDVSDASGMNLMDLRSRRWAEAALACTAPGLAAKLGPLVPSHATLGSVSTYGCRRFGFDENCRVVAFSGDNPNSLAGLRLMDAGALAVSLGTSDTLFGALADPRPSGREGHVFASPVDPEGYMALLCWKNGALTREEIRDRLAEGSWQRFDDLLRASPPGNRGRIGFYFSKPEITPPVMQPVTARFDASGALVEAFSAAEEVRAVVESRFLAMRLHAGNIGITPRRVLATGGASENREMLAILANVFGVPVEVGRRPGSAALGAAYRALHGWTCEQAGRFVAFDTALGNAADRGRILEPDRATSAVYNGLLKRYAELEQRVCYEA